MADSLDRTSSKASIYKDTVVKASFQPSSSASVKPALSTNPTLTPPTRTENSEATEKKEWSDSPKDDGDNSVGSEGSGSETLGESGSTKEANNDLDKKTETRTPESTNGTYSSPTYPQSSSQQLHTSSGHSSNSQCHEEIGLQCLPDGMMDAQLKVLKSAEYFEEVDGRYQCIGTLVVCRHSEHIYHAHTKMRGFNSSTIVAQNLIDIIKIPKDAYQPAWQKDFTLAASSSKCHIKRPSLLSYDYFHKNKPYGIANIVLAEVKVYEILQRNPHSGIAQYLGCFVLEERIVGIGLTQYSTTLMARCNAEHHMKRQTIRYRLSMEKVNHYVNKIRSALQHLHNIGLVHNDINPSNIMFDHNDEPIIIDFNSCRAIGQSLNDVGRTYEWHDPNVQIARAENDTDALDEIYEWLSHKEERAFKFAA